MEKLVRWRVLGLVKARVPWGSLSVGPQVGFRPHGSRAAAKAGHDANCISGSLIFSAVYYALIADTHPPPFVRKKANEKYTLARKDPLCLVCNAPRLTLGV